MSNAQARLIASGLALVAAAIFVHARPDTSAALWAMALGLCCSSWSTAGRTYPTAGVGPNQALQQTGAACSAFETPSSLEPVMHY